MPTTLQLTLHMSDWKANMEAGVITCWKVYASYKTDGEKTKERVRSFWQLWKIFSDHDEGI